VAQEKWDELVFLHGDYQERFMLTEVFETLRKLFLTSVVIVIADNNPGFDVLFGLVVVQLAFAFHFNQFPFRERVYNRMRGAVFMTEWVTMVCLLLLLSVTIPASDPFISTVFDRVEFGVHNSYLITAVIIFTHILCWCLMIWMLFVALRIGIRRMRTHLRNRKHEMMKKKAMARGEVYRAEWEPPSLHRILVALRCAKAWRKKTALKTGRDLGVIAPVSKKMHHEERRGGDAGLGNQDTGSGVSDMTRSRDVSSREMWEVSRDMEVSAQMSMEMAPLAPSLASHPDNVFWNHHVPAGPQLVSDLVYIDSPSPQTGSIVPLNHVGASMMTPTTPNSAMVREMPYVTPVLFQDEGQEPEIDLRVW